jgi:hypothetical protein
VQEETQSAFVPEDAIIFLIRRRNPKMKKALLIGLVLAICMLTLISCARQPAPPPPPPPDTRSTDTPPPPPATPPTGDVKNEIDYITSVTFMYATIEKPAETDLKPVEGDKVPDEAKTVVIKIAKNDKMPDGKEVEVTMVSEDGKTTFDTQTFKSEELKAKDVAITFGKKGKGMNKIVFKEKDSDKSMEKTINVGGGNVEEPKDKDNKEPKDKPDGM